MRKYVKPGAELKKVELSSAVVQVSGFTIESGDSGDNSGGTIEPPSQSLSKGNDLWDDLSDW